ncbi:MAG: hypothetical protein FJX59_07305 [Alphaproteobacteria bacterium]|nr:hypothetical protein [Alphaproteobacteria bacterium]
MLAAAGLRPIGIDLPGYDNSDPPDQAPTVAGWAGIIAPVLDALKIAAPTFSATTPARRSRPNFRCSSRRAR